MQIVINALVLGIMYILAALGFAFIFNMLGTINLGHGALYMVGAYLCYYLCAAAGINNWIAMIISAAVLAVVGLLLERVMFRLFLDNFDRIVMISVGIITICQTIANLLTGSKALVIPSYANGLTTIFGMSISNERLVTFGVGLLLLLATLYVVNYTALGRQMEAVAQDRLGAALQGINTNRVSAAVCAIGVGLAAVAGCFMGAYLGLSSSMGDTMNLRILMLVMLAGAGSMNGIIITGTVMGFLDAICQMAFAGNAGSAVPIIIIVILLLIKPKGFFGHDA
ncbi:MAG: branched-chain amino acid ABC transporter permease [Oscillospiraceae bacterium]|nr:branched-chain amino acid ABC transporter permease [Oscillospiraceae bacterium]